MLKSEVLNLKGQGPLNIKNKCPAAQWEIISYLLIPLKTFSSFQEEKKLKHFI
jgi:hypothetical protein